MSTGTTVARYRNDTLKREVAIFYDEGAPNPLKDETWFRVVGVTHPRYTVGHEQVDRDTLEEMIIEAEADGAHVAALHVNDGGAAGIVLTVGTLPKDPADEHFDGVVIVTAAGADEIGLQMDKAIQQIAGVLDMYAEWMSGQVFGFVKYTVATCNFGHEHLREHDSCWGFIGSDHRHILQEADVAKLGDSLVLRKGWTEV